MNESRGLHAKWNKPGRERQILSLSNHLQILSLSNQIVSLSNHLIKWLSKGIT